MDEKRRVAPTEPKFERKRLEQLFHSLDVNKDGRIDTNELQKKLGQLGIDASEAAHVVRMADRNKDGVLCLDEFLHYCEEKERQLWLLFQKMDSNRDGEIDASEVKQSLEKLDIKTSDAKIHELLKKMDKDGNTRVSWEEWRDFLLLQPHTSMKDIFRIWSHATFSNIGEAMDSVLMPDDFTEEELVSGIWWRQLLAGGGAGAASRTCTAPLDRLKIFFQVQSLQGQKFTIVSCFRHMYSEGGVRSLWRGNGVNVLKIAPESAIRFFMYEKLKGVIQRNNEPLKVYERLLAGSSAGVVAQTVIYPMEVLKTRLALGTTGQYRGIANCFRQIVRNEGVPGLYRGLTPSLVGIIPYAGIDLAVYETLKNYWLSHHEDDEVVFLVPLACGTVSSTCGQLASYPLSLVRTRLQAQRSPVRSSTLNQEKAPGMIQTLTTIAREEGLRGLYRGILPNFMKVLPAVSIGYLVYEHFKKVLGVTSVK